MRQFSKINQSDRFSNGSEYLDKITKSISTFHVFKRDKEQ
jgi:hypothetical protein